jgi:pimeloyl-ACP methyl ester carboxylesterase
MDARIPRFTLDGVPDCVKSTHPFSTEDGLGLTLTRFHRAECDDVILLVHGLTSASDVFIMPEHHNLATFLLESGYSDVWAVDFRMSERFPYNTETHRDTLDDIALFDHPAAVAELRRQIGPDKRIHVIAHCLGSVSFTMSLYAKQVTGIASLTCNSVSLTPRVPAWSRVKLASAPFLSEYLLGISFLDPRFADAPVMTRGWMLSKLVSLFHHECKVPACHLQSFQWGSGHPAMYMHENLLDVTHERMADICGAAGLNYYRHIRKMVGAGNAVKYERSPAYDRLPDDYMTDAADIDTPILFLTGDHNRVFPGANATCHRMLEKVRPGLHELRVLPGYGHLDPLIGKDAHLDVFPHITDFLKKVS